MTFYEFMVGYKRRGLINDLAGDMRIDEEFPVTASTKQEVRQYLDRRGACVGAYDALDRAWVAYTRKIRSMN